MSTEADVLAKALVRFLAAESQQGKMTRKSTASAINALCDGGPQESYVDENKRVRAEMESATADLRAATNAYVKANPESVPKYAPIEFGKELDASLYAMDFFQKVKGT